VVFGFECDFALDLFFALLGEGRGRSGEDEEGDGDGDGEEEGSLVLVRTLLRGFELEATRFALLLDSLLKTFFLFARFFTSLSAFPTHARHASQRPSLTTPPPSFSATPEQPGAYTAFQRPSSFLKGAVGLATSG